ncbi:MULTISPECIES: LAETG motif-containing sortase-dependent surface protein [Streptomycetaceae]|uniref:LAETG motif-containing sortase-dependent surface protein n=1 Tax=Streptomycetaceae TaxID=2062 RepID=UPI000213D50E|nr:MULTISPECIES: LAETG motif-containing sortase-dependent surface protein [Streptomycetaceae]MYS58818.1 Cys-Gln thioester bond-forming surface protein [Streptomyces sp. SID5468]CCB74508.1 conserved exported protein of unknown function [Streptantibioticus cattleyicolor NRRL 8057 = DSM 46488]
MFRGGRRATSRLAAVVLASGLVAAGAVVGTGSAVADETPAAGGATAVLGGLTIADNATIEGPRGPEHVRAGLFEMSVDNGGNIKTYCIDIHNPTQERAGYHEVAWSASSLGSNPDAGKIKWILTHSFPSVDSDALAKEIGVSSLTAGQAAAGTQVAIWRYSDHAKVTADNENAEKLADYLYQHADTSSEPGASLSLTLPAVSGKSGSRIGPVTVHTNAKSAQVTQPGQSGVKVVDANGKPVTSAVDGSKLYFDVPAGTPDGSATLNVHATTSLPVGRVFTDASADATSDSHSQTQILAGSSDSSVSAQATATWAKQGPIPAVSAMVDCAKNGVDVVTTNKGDEAFTFTLAGKQYTVAPGKSETVTVPVKEGQHYAIKISGPKGFEKTFNGILNCKTAGSNGGSTGGSSASPSPAPSSASAGGSATGGSTTGGSNLAETGSSSATPVIAGVAVALVVVGGGTVFFFRKRKSAGAGQ